MTLVGVPALQRGVTSDDAVNPKQHYELWATLGVADNTGAVTADRAVRLLEQGFTVESVLGRIKRDPLPTADADPAEYLTVDPCMIDRDSGERRFYKPSELTALAGAMGWTIDDTGDTSSPEYLDRARRQRRTVDLALNNIDAVISYAARTDVPQDTPIGDDAAAFAANNAARLATCKAFFAGADCADDACRNDRARYYVGEPEEMTYPVNGIFYGLLGENAEVQDPWSHGLLGGIELSPPYELTDLVGLFLTLEDDVIDPATGSLTVDPENRGPVLTSGTALTTYRGLYRVPLANAARTIYGTASVYYNLDADPVQF